MDQAIWRTSEIVKRAKQVLVSRDGIGADITPVIIAYGAEDDELLGFAQISEPPKTAMDQYRKMTAACFLMRSTWQAKKIAVVIDGYVAIRTPEEEQPEAHELVARFAAGDASVQECLSIICHTEDDVSHYMTLPYRIGLGKKVEWLEDTAYVEGAEPSGAYAKMLHKIMTEVEPLPFPTAVPVEAAMCAFSLEIHDLGFFVTCEALGEGQDWLDEIQYGEKR